MEIKNTTLFSWIRNQNNAIAIFIGLFTNLMVFSQPLQNAIASQNQSPFNLNSSNSSSLTEKLEAVNSVNEKLVNTISTNLVRKKNSTSNLLDLDANTINAVEKQGIIDRKF